MIPLLVGADDGGHKLHHGTACRKARWLSELSLLSSSASGFRDLPRHLPGTYQTDTHEYVPGFRRGLDSETSVTLVVVPSENGSCEQVDDDKEQSPGQFDIVGLFSSDCIPADVALTGLHLAGTKRTKDHRLGNTKHVLADVELSS